MIPLPLPGPVMSLSITDKTKGVASFRRTRDSNFNSAYFFIFNESTGKGVIRQAEVDGSVTSDPFMVQDGQYLSIWVKRAASEERSDIVNLVVDFSDPRNIKDRMY